MESLCFVALFGLILTFSFNSCQGASWKYGTGAHGVYDWAVDYPGQCDGQSQSPIDLTTSVVQYDSNLQDFQFTNFDTIAGVTMTLLNNGHAAQVNYGGTTNLEVSGGSLGGTYRVAQFHFHWGSDNTKGSEHTVDLKAFPMEIHIVCFNTKYTGLSQAVGNADGLAVLGYFFEISEPNNPTVEKITSELSEIMYGGNQTVLTPFPLTDIMGGVGAYYRYKGGLTTPTCNEVVTWTVFQNTIKLSSAQMAKFRTLKYSSMAPLVDNYRPVQSRNGRLIRSSFDVSSAPGQITFSGLALALSLVLSLWCRL